MTPIANQDISDWLNGEFFETGIDADSCSAQWYAGERMDWDMVVGNLFQ